MKYNFQEIRYDKTKISLANCQSETVGIEMESDFILTLEMAFSSNRTWNSFKR